MGQQQEPPQFTGQGRIASVELLQPATPGDPGELQEPHKGTVHAPCPIQIGIPGVGICSA